MEPIAVREHARRERIDLQLYARVSEAQRRELGAFVRFCVARIERELGESDHWMVKVDPSVDGYQGTVVARQGTLAVQSTGRGLDGALAIWDALCRLEQVLREVRSRSAERSFRA
jgi:hypothetical protein